MSPELSPQATSAKIPRSEASMKKKVFFMLLNDIKATSSYEKNKAIIHFCSRIALLGTDGKEIADFRRI